MRTALVIASLLGVARASDPTCCTTINSSCRSCILGMSVQDYCFACVYQGLNDAGCFDCPRTAKAPTGLSKCQIQAQQAMSIPGRYTPQCTADGSFSALQCHASTGYCWCVDTNGQEMEGTRQPPGQIPDCTKVSLSPCQLQSTQASRGYGGFRPRCEADGSFSALQCHGSTGYCWCSTPAGVEIDGSRTAAGTMPNCTRAAPLTDCQQRVEEAAGMIGEFVPQCEADGSYSSLQCFASTGNCWCVQPDGTQIAGSNVGPGEMVACSVFTQSLCHLQAMQAGRGLGAFRPQCEDDGSFSKMQCHVSTGSCWCVDQQTGIEISNTRVGPGNMPNCNAKLRLTECQTKVAAAAPVFGAFVPQCERDGSYSALQCHGSTGYCWCVTADGKEVPNSRKGPGIPMNCTSSVPSSLTACQAEAMQASRGYGSFRPQCEADGSYAKLQCHSSTGYCWCVESNGKAIESTRRGPGNVPDCDGLGNSAMTACRMQVAQSSRLDGAYVPQCEEDGSYSSLQCHGSTGYCWCVDANGVEIDNTRKGPGRVPDCTVPTLTPCQLQQTQASRGYGSFSPQCNDDGSYNSVQCHPSTGYCWCVQINGIEINDTRVAPGNVPNCSRLHSEEHPRRLLGSPLHGTVSELSECETIAAQSAGRRGAFTPQCEKDGTYSALQCWSSTGNCWCVSSDGQEKPGSRRAPGQGVPDCDLFLLSPCQLQRKQACVGVGSFRPRCNDDGSYSALQCHGSTGYCWCVSPDGTEIENTRVGPGGAPTCASTRAVLAPRGVTVVRHVLVD